MSKHNDCLFSSLSKFGTCNTCLLGGSWEPDPGLSVQELLAWGSIPNAGKIQKVDPCWGSIHYCRIHIDTDLDVDIQETDQR